jgi:hypothetical protein
VRVTRVQALRVHRSIELLIAFLRHDEVHPLQRSGTRRPTSISGCGKRVPYSTSLTPINPFGLLRPHVSQYEQRDSRKARRSAVNHELAVIALSLS